MELVVLFAMIGFVSLLFASVEIVDIALHRLRKWIRRWGLHFWHSIRK